MADETAFRVGRLDHVHIRVGDRDAAARWYAEHLGMEPVERYRFWSDGIEDGPLQISADGGLTMLALFQASEGHPLVPLRSGVAFSVDVDMFCSFIRSLPNGIDSPAGQPLRPDDLVDFDLCWAIDIADPWGNVYEINNYEYDRIRTELVEADGIEAQRYWPREVNETYQDRSEGAADPER